MAATTLEIETPQGPARAHLHPAPGARLALVIGHGAGGGVEAPDIQAARDAALDAGVSVALAEQPYRVAGRRSPAPAKQLDAAWLAIVAHLRTGPLAGLSLVVGGRSLGARVACRTAAQTEAVGVLCLAFPLSPPARGGGPRKNRLPELEAVDVPVLVIQGRGDPFGMPPPGPKREVVQIEGNHGLKREHDKLRAAVSRWLAGLAS